MRFGPGFDSRRLHPLEIQWVCLIGTIMRYVYVLRNLVNGKVYIGQTINLARRKAGHMYAARKGSEYPLYRAIRKHGENSFIFEALEECRDEQIDEREKFWICQLDSRNPEKGYNLAPGGRSASTEAHRKISDALKGNTHCVGRKASDETRQALRKCWPIVMKKKFGEPTWVTELRTCRCGTQFEVTYASNRKYHVRTSCSRKCANTRNHSEETKQKIRESRRTT